jgi:hypothetical protein
MMKGEAIRIKKGTCEGETGWIDADAKALDEMVWVHVDNWNGDGNSIKHTRVNKSSISQKDREPTTSEPRPRPAESFPDPWDSLELQHESV